MAAQEQTKTQIYNLIILDSSGSMTSVRKAAVDGYNETLGSIRAAQRKLGEKQEHYISLVTFCGCGVKTIYDCVPVDKAQTLEDVDYRPCCMTPLYDAIGASVMAINRKVEGIDDPAVIVTIITDGEENASREWTRADISRLIDEHKQQGWIFSYMGADHNVAGVASSISITNTITWKKCDDGAKDAFRSDLGARMRCYAQMSEPAYSSMSSDEKIKARKSMSASYFTPNKGFKERISSLLFGADEGEF